MNKTRWRNIESLPCQVVFKDLSKHMPSVRDFSYLFFHEIRALEKL